MGKLLQLKPAAKNRAEIIDEFGDAQAAVAAFKPTQDRYEQLAKEIRSWYDDKPAEQEFCERGVRYSLTIQPRSQESSIDAKGVHKKLGLAGFLKVVSITIKALECVLPKAEAEAFITRARTGSRRLNALLVIQAPGEDPAA